MYRKNLITCLMCFYYYYYYCLFHISMFVSRVDLFSRVLAIVIEIFRGALHTFFSHADVHGIEMRLEAKRKILPIVWTIDKKSPAALFSPINLNLQKKLRQ